MNVYAPVQSLQKSNIDVGGACSIAYFKIEDVQTWPEPDPVTGIITNSIVMKAGKSIYICQAAEKGRSYTEELKYGTGGPFMDIQVTAMLGGNNTANILSLDTMKFHQWGLIVKDRGGYYRLIGNAEKGAKIIFKHTPGDAFSSRKVDVLWNWGHENSAPLYQAQTFTITIGGVTITAGTLTLILRFQVGHSPAGGGAPVMNNGDTVLTRAGFANKNLLVLVDGLALPCDDLTGTINWSGSIVRHYEKALASNSLTVLGGVLQDEVYEIYAWS